MAVRSVRVGDFRFRYYYCHNTGFEIYDLESPVQGLGGKR